MADPHYSDIVSLVLLLGFFAGVLIILFSDATSAKRVDPWTDPDPLTAEDPRCQVTAARQRRVAAKMMREGKLLLTGRKYRPALTKPSVSEPAPKADKVVPIRRRP